MVVYDQRHVVGLFPLCELQSCIYVQGKRPDGRNAENSQYCNKHANKYNLYELVHFEIRLCHCVI